MRKKYNNIRDKCIVMVEQVARFVAHNVFRKIIIHKHLLESRMERLAIHLTALIPISNGPENIFVLL